MLGSSRMAALRDACVARRPIFRAAAVGCACLGVALAGCDGPGKIIQLDEARDVTPEAILPAPRLDDHAEEDLNPRLLRRFVPIAAAPPATNRALLDLGRILYFEPLLSRTGLLSCNSCHPLATYGTTPTAVLVGVDGLRAKRNAPSTYNVGGHFRMFWDGRGVSLEDQIGGPSENHDEMGMSAAAVMRRLSTIPGYAPLFAAAFPGEARGTTIDDVTQAIAAFERGLVTPARWDEYLSGDVDALTSAEKAGAKLFANTGCMVCHTGALLGATTFEKLGVRSAWPDQADRGRRNVTGSEADDLLFKVPSLRNVARTPPYFHDGSVSDLSEAVALMARHQLGLELLAEETRSIVKFLGCLTGDLPLDYVEPPTLPAARRP